MSSDVLILKSITGVTIKAISPIRASRAQSGQRQSVDYGGGYWVIGVNTAVGPRENHDPIFAFLNDKRGAYDTFGLILQHYSYSKSTYKGSILVNGASQVGRNIAVKGMTASKAGILRKGDFISFQGFKKVYQVTEDLNSDGAGEGTLKLHMGIVGTSPNDNNAVIFNDVTFNVCSAEDFTLDLDVMRYAGWDLKFEEVWN